MISPAFFINTLSEHGVDFFTGVPDSLLKSVCAYITDHKDSNHHVIAANEGGAVALATGYHLATGHIGCVYMQNSGLGNVVNPLASLTDREVYGIPMLLLIGWRGRPGQHDEPQHVKQGKITTGLLNVLGVNYEVLSHDESTAARQISHAMDEIKSRKEVFALVIEKDTFEPYTLQQSTENNLSLGREEAIGLISESIEHDTVVVSTTGMISRELFEYRSAKGEGHERDFLTVGSMGHASQIALGIAMQHPERKVYCLDGDGATIMHMGALAITGSRKQKNFVHMVLNNGAHDSVGGQPTAGFDIDLVQIALGCGYRKAIRIDNRDELNNLNNIIKDIEGPVFVEIRVRRGNRKDLGRPTTTPLDNKMALMDFLMKESSKK